MKKFVKLLIGTVASLGIASTAVAGTFAPTPGTTVYSADVEVRKLLTLHCEITAPITSNGVITNNPGTTGTFVDYVALAAGDSNCDNVEFTSTNMPVTTIDDDEFLINNITVVGITGNCAGSLRAQLNQTTGVITFSHLNTIPATSGLGPCSVQSVSTNPVTTTPPASYTP
jgi:hypothetical protein